MITGVKQMSCGGCGSFVFMIYAPPEGATQALHIECGECKSITIIRPDTPSLVKHWGPGATGLLTVMPGQT